MSDDKQTELNPKRRQHDRQYWDDTQKRYVDLPERFTEAELAEQKARGHVPNRRERRAWLAMAKRKAKRREQ